MPKYRVFFALIALLRLHKPIGIWLLFWPCAWALALASTPAFPALWDIGLFFVGAVLLRSAGCILNDLWDRRIDGAVERTRHRPLATGAVSVRQAVIVLGGVLLLGLGILVQFPQKAIVFGVLALPLVALYPSAKRWCPWPQVFLALTFNWGALLAPLAILGGIPPWAGWLYAASVCWTLAYDTLYSVQDVEGDTALGLHSGARLFGKHTPWVVAGCYILHSGCLVWAAWQAGMAIAAVEALGVLSLGLSARTLYRAQPLNPASASKAFQAHGMIGGVLFIALLLLGGFARGF